MIGSEVRSLNRRELIKIKKDLRKTGNLPSQKVSCRFNGDIYSSASFLLFFHLVRVTLLLLAYISTCRFILAIFELCYQALLCEFHPNRLQHQLERYRREPEGNCYEIALFTRDGNCIPNGSTKQLEECFQEDHGEFAIERMREMKAAGILRTNSPGADFYTS